MPEAQTVLGFDYGQQRIGIAVGQTLTHTVTPLTTLKAVNQKPDWQGIERLIQEWQPQLLVVGLPLHMDGSEHALTKAARRFGQQLKGRYNLPVAWMDERLSSVEAEDYLRQHGGKTRSQKQDIDKIAASLILQGWLEQQQAK